MKKKFITIFSIILALILIFGVILYKNNNSNFEKDASTFINSTNKKVLLDVPYINQKEKYPTGCESVSTVMALQYLGIDITVEEFIDNYLKMSDTPKCNNPQGDCFGYSPWDTFVGNPYSDKGFGCFAPVINHALSKFLDFNKYEVKEMYDIPIETLCSEYIDKGIPVVFWGTINMSNDIKKIYWYDVETKEKIDWIQPMHCMLLVGYDDDYYYFNDPSKHKYTKYPKKNTEISYNATYRQSLAIIKK